jgi:glutathione synthase
MACGLQPAARAARAFGKAGDHRIRQFTPPPWSPATCNNSSAFIDEQRDIILKPLDGMGGSQIFRIHRNDPNRNVIIETLTHEGTRTIMAQRYLPEISAGDKRIC